uniref:Uncharacterized protein n=1 Tax=Tanacetum cinerariifolium TaxID=118510 RepID=A0A6L2KZU7_TANCI|nr:hypothetical protein [Tanacetum cinerariifolium]
MQKNLALIAKYFKKIYKPTNNNLRTSSNFKNKNADTTLRYKNDDHSRQFGTQRTVNVDAARENVGRVQKPKGVKDSAYHKEKMLMCKQAEQGVPLQAEQYDWLADTMKKLMNKNWKHITTAWLRSRRFPQLIQALTQNQWNSNTCLVETDDSIAIPDSPDMCEDDIQNDQNDVESDDERVALANLIANLKLDVDENKKIQKQLKKANTTLAQELKECKAILAETNLFRASTAHDMEILIQTCLMPLAIKTQSDSLKFVHELKQEMHADLNLKFVHELKQEMHADLKYVESLEKEINERESEKAEFSDMYDVILQDCVSKDVMCSYLQSLSDIDALAELQCMYLHKVKECDCLAQKLSKQTDSVSKKVKNDTVCNEKASNVFRKEREQYFKIQDLKAKLQEKNIAISELKKLIEKGKGISVDTKFDRLSVVRQPNAQRIPKPSVLGKPAPFLISLDRIYFQKTRSVPKANVSEGLSKPVTVQTLPQAAKKAE